MVRFAFYHYLCGRRSGEWLEGKTGGRETGSAVAVTGFESMLTWTTIEAMPTGRSADLGTTWERPWGRCRAGWIWVGREKEQCRMGLQLQA